ncbi:MAG: 3'-5' exonuclease [Bacteriovoracaceae bacterium]|jgi:DNA polymerase III subunit epsilon|nr:3'-5' exonuclease [Bacteriovoracaceae bacterium]
MATTQNESNQTSQEIIDNLTFCVFDLETTGGNHSYDKIIEIGMIKMKGREIVDEMGLLIDPQVQIPEFIQKLTSLTPEILEGKPTIDQVLEEILEFMGDSILVAHNSSFDVPFFNSVLSRMKRAKLKNRVICTNLMTKYLIPEIMNSNLTYMSQIFGIPHQKAHRALEDAKAAGMLLKNFLDIFVQKNIRKVNQLYYPRNKFELDRVHFQRENGVKEILSKVSTVSLPITVTIKADQGIILAIFPLKSGTEDLTFLGDFLETSNWKMVTLKLVGSYFEGLLNMAQHFTKYSPDHSLHLIEKICKDMNIINLEELQEGFKIEKSFFYQQDFLLVPHLIPEQLIVYPLVNLIPKKELIFRYPGHKKKVIQFISGQVRRFPPDKKKYRKSFIAKELLPIFDHFLNNIADKTWGFKSDLPLKSQGKFYDKVTTFIEENEIESNYPKMHL